MVSFGALAIVLVLIVVGVVVALVSSTLKTSEDGKPRGFPWVLMLFGGVVVAGVVALILVRARPVNYVLDVTVPAGKGFIGEVIVDGRREVIEDIGSKQFEFTGNGIRWRVLIDDEAAGTESIAVHLTGGFGGSSSSNWGTPGLAQKRFLGGGAMFTSIDEAEWRTLMRELKPEKNEAGDSLLPGLSAPSNLGE